MKKYFSELNNKQGGFIKSILMILIILLILQIGFEIDVFQIINNFLSNAWSKLQEFWQRFTAPLG